jgi:hypothetical protein
MYEPHEGGTSVTIDGMECHLPPQPSPFEIMNSHLPTKKQMWRRTELPTFRVLDIEWFSGSEPEDLYEEVDWETARREEVIKQTGTDPWLVDSTGNPKELKHIEPDPNYVSEPLNDFRLQEYDRIFNGFWFYNNGIATYINGMYYFYLNWWKMDVGYPKYREPDRELFYLVSLADTDDRCFGLLYITKRGTGKSFIAGVLAYLIAITNKKAHIGIQSKTDEDAKDLFSTKIAEPYKDLPDFLIPINKHGTNPSSGMDFSPRTVTGRKAIMMRKYQKTALRTKLDFRNAGEKAYDGTSLRFLIQDEVGKVEEKYANVYKRWIVNRECVFRDNRKRGIGFLTTTVEEMDKGGDPCKKLWYDSNIAERSKNGRTKTWLYRYFRSAIDSAFFDEYGFPLRDKARAFFEAERELLQSDPTSLISYIQKNPFTIEEAFMTQGENCIYNAAILQERQVTLGNPDVKEKIVRVGDFKWKDDIPDSTVVFMDNETNGMWEVSYLNISDESKNKKVRWGEFNGVTQWELGVDNRRVIGYDPYSHKRTQDINKESEAGAAVFQKYDFHIPEEHTDTFIADFAGRLTSPDLAHEQVIMAAVFFGAMIFPESNKYGAIDYIERRGYSKYIMERPSSSGSSLHYRGVKGMPSNTSTITYYTEKTKNHVDKFGKKLKHLRIVRDWLEFNPQNTTKYDSGVAASFAIVAADKPISEESESLDISELFPTFDHSGTEGKFN